LPAKNEEVPGGVNLHKFFNYSKYCRGDIH